MHGVEPALLAFCLVSGLGETLYWTSYHAYFALLGDAEHRGHQLGASVALSALIGIVAPLIGAWALLGPGPRSTFAAAGLVQALAVLPLVATPNVRVPRTAPGALRASLPGVGLATADGWFAVSYVLVWQIALFLSLDRSVAAYGGAVALAATVGALTSLFLGRHIDAGHGRQAVAIAFSAISLTLLARAWSVGTPWLAVAANALGAFASCLMVPAQMTPVYNLAKASPCALRFHVAAEGGWDLGHIAGCLCAALLVAHGAALGSVIPHRVPRRGGSGVPAAPLLPASRRLAPRLRGCIRVAPRHVANHPGLPETRGHLPRRHRGDQGRAARLSATHSSAAADALASWRTTSADVTGFVRSALGGLRLLIVSDRSTSRACARSAPTRHFSRGICANGSKRKWRRAFACVIWSISASGTPASWASRSSGERGQVVSECG